MTSLSDQLRRLALPAAAKPDLNRRPSLLFDQKKAATLDRDTYYALGVNGLEELASIDGTISEDFFEAFFSETAKNTERTMLSQKDNDWLDERIQSFFFRISPYFLLRPAQKCLEWMIHRFRVHSFNVDEMLRAFLPYHETNLFVRLVQTFDISHPTSKWYWIAPIQKPGVTLAKSTISMHCYKDNSFLHFVCDMVPMIVKAHARLPDPSHAVRVMVNFYTTTVLSMFSHVDVVSDQLLAQLVPFFVKTYYRRELFQCAHVLKVLGGVLCAEVGTGLKSKAVDYKAATYMIISQVLTKVTLTGQVATSLMKSLCKQRTNKLARELLTTVLILAQTQENLTAIPKRSFEEICKISGFVDILEESYQKFETDRFLRLFLKRLVPNALVATAAPEVRDSDESDIKDLGPRPSELLMRIVQHFKLPFPLQKLIIRLMIEGYIDLSEPPPESSKLLKQVHRKYPEAFDNVIADLSSSSSNDAGRVEQLNKFITLSVESAKHQNVSGDASLVLSLCHPEEAVRVSAIQCFESMFPDHPALTTSDFVRESIIQRLACDDSPAVALEALKLVSSHPEVLFHDLDMACEVLIKLIYRNRYESEWNDVILAALTLATSEHLANASNLTRGMVALVVYDVMLLEMCAQEKASMYNIAVRSSYMEQNTDILFSLDPDLDVPSLVNRVSSTIQNVKDPLPKLRVLFEASGRISQMLTSIRSDDRPAHLAAHYVVCAALFELAERQGHFSPELSDLFDTAMTNIIGDAKSLLMLQMKLNNQPPGTTSVSGFDASDYLPANLMQLVVAQQGKSVSDVSVASLNISLSLIRKCFESLSGYAEGSQQKGNCKERYWDAVETDKAEESYHSRNFTNYRHKIFSVILELMYTCDAGVKLESTVADVKKLVQLFLTKMFSNAEDVLYFLAPYWSSQAMADMVVSPRLKAQTIYLGNAMLQSSLSVKKNVDKVLGPSSPVVPSLLIALADDTQAVRKGVIACLATCLQTSHKFVYKDLVENLVSHKEEMQIDRGTIADVLGIFFAEPTPKRKSRRKTTQSSTLDILLTNHICNPLVPMYVRASLLKLLREVSSEKFFISILPTLEDLLAVCLSSDAKTQGSDAPDVTSADGDTGRAISDCDALFIQEGLSKFKPDYLDKKAIKSFFLRAMSCVNEISSCEDKALSIQLLILGLINRAFFSKLSSTEIQQEIISKMLDVGADSQSSSTVTAISKVFKNIRLDGPIVVTEIQKLLQTKSAQSSEGAPTTKRSRRLSTSKESSVGSGNMDAHQVQGTKLWKRSVLLIELLQHKKKISNSQVLFAPVFNLLDYVLEATGEKGEGIEESVLETFEYVKQLALTTLLNLVQKGKSKTDTKGGLSSMSEIFKVELLVHCVRSTDNSQTQQHALLLLSEVATVFPEKVLHNVMAIFTFMGSHLLRQDDSYSFQVITSTIRTIIPALVKSGTEENNNRAPTQDTILKVLRVFTDSLLHIPAHRRLAVFEELLHTLGEKEHLWVILVHLVDQYACNPTLGRLQGGEVSHATLSEEETDSLSPLDAAMEMWRSICGLASPVVQVESLITHLEYLLTVPDEIEESRGSRRKPQPVRSGMYPDAINIQLRSTKQLRRFKLASLTFFVHVLEKGRSKFIVKVATDGEAPAGEDLVMAQSLDSTQAAAKMTVLFQRFFEKLLRLILNCSSNKDGVEKGQDVGKEKFHKALTNKAYDVMHKINYLLPMDAFLLVIGGLLKHDVISTRRKALELLSERINFIAGDFHAEEVPLVLRLAPELMDLAEKPAVSAGEMREENMLRYSSLLTLKLVIRSCAKQNPDDFVAMLPALGRFVSDSKTEDVQVLSAALLCIAEECTCLKAYCIPHLNCFVPSIVRLTCTSRALTNENLLFSCVTAMHRLLENLPNFLSPYLDGIISKVASLSLLEKFKIHEKVQNEQSSDVSVQIGMRLRAIMHVLATKIQSRVLVPALQHCREQIEHKRPKGIACLSAIAHRHVTSLDKDGITQNGSVLVIFFLEMLDCRSKKGEEMQAQDLDEVEDTVIDALITMMLKFSENSFRPLFFKLYDWACLPDNPPDRLITYYKLMYKLSDKMKGLFALFAGHLLSNVAELLKNRTSGSSGDELWSGDGQQGQKNHLLICYICDMLRSTMLHDTTGFLTKDRFELLLHPVVDQLENVANADSETEREQNEVLVSGHVIPLLGQLAASVADDVCWKPFNYQILLKSRHSSPKVRYAALDAVREVAEKLGEDYTILLPESVPFLAELMEDDAEVVEKKCHEVIRRLEKVLGEPLQKYF